MRARTIESLPLPGDGLLPGPASQVTHALMVGAPPERIWPWLAQMGRGRAGFYGVDLIDNGGARSARDLHPELGAVSPGDVLVAGARGGIRAQVLLAEEPNALVLGGVSARRGGRPALTWAFLLERAGRGRTRLIVRTRAARGRLPSAWTSPAGRAAQRIQLRNIARRAEGRLPANDWRDVLAGLAGAGVIGLSLATPFLRGRRTTWGAGPRLAASPHAGDELLPGAAWGWTHAVEVAAPAAAVWPWLAQIGADRAGFYSYSWLENLAGCGVRDAERVHPEWEAREGGELRIHPSMPPLRIAAVERGRHVLATAPADEAARAEGRPWIAVTWLFELEPLGAARCRVVSRYRCAHSADLRTRLGFGPGLLEPIGFAMDRRMLRGLARRAASAATA
ncbi:MAG TPA: hypothetical protein VK904_03375 [Miltoncostaeaceae bacterium]|nr:hypothetical protein [Miltoncostaeaceae bacterium]